MAISSNSIMHFTNSKKALEGILRDNFKIHYCSEQISCDDTLISLAIPMVSFCDITLSQAKEHIEKYGKYGIGLTKEWAIRKQLNPVLYIEQDSLLANSYKEFFKKYFNKKTKLNEKDKQFLDIARYLKNYQNDLVRHKKTFSNYRFYDEREWRYTLDYGLHEDFFLPLEDLDKKKSNKNIEKYRLEFEPNDIKYIIIKEESEINEFITILRSAKGRNFTMDDVEKLTTRIITSKQILEDF